MTELVPCPLCGADKGYYPPDAKKFLWLSICCASCGSEIAKQLMASAPPAEWPDRLDAAWNAAGKHAQGLRDKIAGLRALLRRCLPSVDACCPTATALVAPPYDLESPPLKMAVRAALAKELK